MFTLFGLTVVVLFIGVTIKFLIPTKFREAIVAQLRKGSRDAWKSDPIAIYQSRVEQAAEELAAGKEKLVEFRGMVAMLERQVKDHADTVSRLDARIRAALEAKNEGDAQRYAERMVKAQADLSTSRENLTTHMSLYQEQVKRVKAVCEKIEAAKDQAHTLQSQLDLSRVEKHMVELNNGMANGSVMDGLSEVEEEIQRQIDANRSTATVATDLGLEHQAGEEEGVAQESAAQLLNRYKEKMAPVVQ